MKPEIQLTDYILHLGETGKGLGVALVWHEAGAPVVGHATVAPESAHKRNLLIDDGKRVLALIAVERQLYDQVLREGLHVIWQDSEGKVKHEHCSVAPPGPGEWDDHRSPT